MSADRKVRLVLIAVCAACIGALVALAQDAGALLPYVTYSAGGGGAVETSYDNAGGKGNRTSSIVITSSNIAWSASTAALINGVLTAESLWWADGGDYVDPTPGAWVMFDFGASAQKIVQEVRWIQSAAFAHGVWKWQGSDDGAAFTDLCASNTFAASVTNVWNEMASNETGYRYYRMFGLSGTHRGDPIMVEVEFKIADE